MASKNDDALFTVKSAERAATGPVYQGVCKQIRTMTSGPEPLIDKNLWAGTIAAARSLAASIDAVDHRGPGQANGVPLAAMHAQLDALLARMNPEADTDDPFLAELASWREDEKTKRQEASRDDAAAPPHPEV